MVGYKAGGGSRPVLANLGETQLMLGAIGLTAFNDNAAITYLASLVPNFSDALKYAVVAVAGGGLTVIANAKLTLPGNLSSPITSRAVYRPWRSSSGR